MYIYSYRLCVHLYITPTLLWLCCTEKGMMTIGRRFRIGVYICTHTQIYIKIDICMYMYTYTCIHIYIYITPSPLWLRRTNICIITISSRFWRHTHIYSYTHIYIHIHTYMHIHIYTHTKKYHPLAAVITLHKNSHHDDRQQILKARFDVDIKIVGQSFERGDLQNILHVIVLRRMNTYYWVATISRFLKIIGLFCKRAL